MEIIPAIDLMQGKIVRLFQGKPSHKVIYTQYSDPISLAREFSTKADRIHIIDLDAATGSGDNFSLIKRLVKDVKAPFQVGGGLSKENRVKKLLDIGVDRIIVGSMAFQSLDLLMSFLDEYGSSRIVIALDHINGNIAIKGWKEVISKKVNESLAEFMDLGFFQFLITSVIKDGSMEGTDIPFLKEMIKNHPTANIIAAGGVKSIDEIITMRNMGIDGIVIGKALYEGKLSLQDIKNTIK